MTRYEKIELASIPALGLGAWLATPLLPGRMSFGTLLLVAAVLLLLQGLVRDLALLARSKREAHSTPEKAARCLCIESAVGVTGVAAGLILMGAGIGRTIELPVWTWAALAVGVTGAGFALKDYVVTLWPWRIRREADHLNLIFTWKR